MKKLAKTLNKIFNDPKFIKEMSENCTSVQQMQYQMGHIMSYYISTRDPKIHSYGDLVKLTHQPPEPKNVKKKETNEDAYIRNTITEGAVTHSFNGFNLPKIKKNGLGSEKNYDKTLAEELSKLEKDLGCSEFVEKQTNGSSEIYYTTPGANSVYYAMQQSPERLFHGPLNQGNNPLPVIVGEKKEDYYMRVAIDKINRNYKLEDQKPILDNARKVITKLCSQRPQIALIPITSKKHELNASLAVEYGNKMPLSKYIEHQAGGNLKFWAPNFFFSDTLGGAYHNNCSNLVSTGVKVPANELGIFSVPDTFEIMQLKAKQNGLKPGEKFNLYTMEKVEENQEDLESQNLSEKLKEKVLENDLSKDDKQEIEKKPEEEKPLSEENKKEAKPEENEKTNPENKKEEDKEQHFNFNFLNKEPEIEKEEPKPEEKETPSPDLEKEENTLKDPELEEEKQEPENTFEIPVMETIEQMTPNNPLDQFNILESQNNTQENLFAPNAPDLGADQSPVFNFDEPILNQPEQSSPDLKSGAPNVEKVDLASLNQAKMELQAEQDSTAFQIQQEQALQTHLSVQQQASQAPELEDEEGIEMQLKPPTSFGPPPGASGK